MSHKNLLVTHTLYRLKSYSEAHPPASAAPAASFKSASRTSGVPELPENGVIAKCETFAGSSANHFTENETSQAFRDYFRIAG